MTVTRARPEACLSDLTLDRLVVGELADLPTGRSARQHLAGCASCTARLAELELELAGFTAPRTTRTSRRTWIPVAVVGLAAAVAAIVIMPGSKPADHSTRIKGGFALSIIAKHHDGRTEELLPDAAVTAGDAIRFALSSSEPGFVGIVGVDAAGAVTPYVPASGELVAFTPGHDQLLDATIVLDATAGSERFVAVACRHPVAVESIVTAARRALAVAAGDPRHLPALELDCRETSFIVHKAP